MIDESPELQQREGNLRKLLELIPSSWPQPDEKFRCKFLAIAERIMHDPETALRALDMIAARAPAAAAYLAELSQMQVHYEEKSEREIEHLAVAMRRFRDVTAFHNYQELRPHLLWFCLNEQIGPDQFSRLPPEATEYPLSDNTSLVDQASTDAAMCFVYRSHRALWT